MHLKENLVYGNQEMTTCNSQNGSTPQLSNVHFGRSALLLRYGSLHLTSSEAGAVKLVLKRWRKLITQVLMSGRETKREGHNVKPLSSIYEVDQVSPLKIYCWRSLYLIVGTG